MRMSVVLSARRIGSLRPLSIQNSRYLSSSSSSDESSSSNTATPVKYPRNPNLKQVISQGMPFLEACSLDVMQNSRESLFTLNPGPSPNQLSEARRIFETVSGVVDRIAETTGEFCIQGFPIVLLDAEVSPDCKQARVFWCLPLHLCDLTEAQETQVQERMQQILQGRRGSVIQSQVFARLRFYYPPKLRFVPVPIQTAMESFLQDDN